MQYLIISVLLITLFSTVYAQQQGVSAQSDLKHKPAPPFEFENLCDQIDRNRDAHIAFLQELIHAQEKGEKAVQELVVRKLEEIGCKTEVLKVLPSSIRMDHEFAADEAVNDIERINVVGTYPGRGGGKSLLVYGHPDPVPNGSKDGWTHDPYGAEIEGDKLYGYGVADDLEGIAIMCEAMAALHITGFRPRGNIYLGSATTKQNARGIIAILGKGYVADACIYLHPEETGVGMTEIQNITPGILNFRITVSGQQPPTNNPGKTAFAHQGINAIEKGVIIIQALKELDTERGEWVKYEIFDKRVGRSTNLMISSIGSKGNIPTQCDIECSISFPPTEKMADVQKQIESCLENTYASDPWFNDNNPSLTWLFGAEGMELPADHPIYKTVSASIEKVTGEKPEMNPMHAASSIFNPFLYSDIPSVAYGPLCGNLTQNGLNDEWIDVPDYIRAIKVTAKVMADWTGSVLPENVKNEPVEIQNLPN